MPTNRHRLTQLVAVLFLVSGLACEKVHERGRDIAADSGSRPSSDAGPLADAAARSGNRANNAGGPTAADSGSPTRAAYALCDGSDQIRFRFLTAGGGAVEPGYDFDHPYGHQFIYIDGHCDFTFTERSDAQGTITRGHLDQDTAKAFAQLLELDELPEGVYFDQQNCNDGSGSSIVTAHFYGECLCDCEPGAPAVLKRALDGPITEAFDMLRAHAAAASGEVELLAIARDPRSERGDAPEWPFAWPIADVINESLLDQYKPYRTRLLKDADAEKARRLRSEADPAGRGRRAVVKSEVMLYQLLARDILAPKLAARITHFDKEANPRRRQPLAACESDQDVAVEIGAKVYDQQLRFWFKANPVCGLRICWDGELQERQPVVAPLRVVKAAQPRPCLSTPEGSVLDLEPLVSAFRSSHPDAKLEIELSLPGWSDGEVPGLFLNDNP